VTSPPPHSLWAGGGRPHAARRPGSQDYVTANPHASRLVGLTEGFQSAFGGCVVLAAVGVVLSLTLLTGRGRTHEELQPAAAPD